MLGIILGSLWLIGAVLLSVFNRRIYIAIAELNWNKRRKSSLGNSYTGRTIKQETYLTNLMLKGTSAIWAIFAVNSIAYIHKAVSRFLNPDDVLLGPQVLQPVYTIYGKYFYPIILFVVAGFFFYVLIKGLYMINSSSISIYNSTNNTLDIFIQERFIGKVDPGRRIQNTRILPLYPRYLIEAKDANGSEIYSRQFKIDELDKIGGKLNISA